MEIYRRKIEKLRKSCGKSHFGSSWHQLGLSSRHTSPNSANWGPQEFRFGSRLGPSWAKQSPTGPKAAPGAPFNDLKQICDQAFKGLRAIIRSIFNLMFTIPNTSDVKLGLIRGRTRNRSGYTRTLYRILLLPVSCKK